MHHKKQLNLLKRYETNIFKDVVVHEYMTMQYYMHDPYQLQDTSLVVEIVGDLTDSQCSTFLSM